MMSPGSVVRVSSMVWLSIDCVLNTISMVSVSSMVSCSVSIYGISVVCGSMVDWGM